MTYNSPSRAQTYNLAVNRKHSEKCRKAQKSIVFSILASFWIFARVRIRSRFFASYRGIYGAKRYKTVVAFWQYWDVIKGVSITLQNLVFVAVLLATHRLFLACLGFVEVD